MKKIKFISLGLVLLLVFPTYVFSETIRQDMSYAGLKKNGMPQKQRTSSIVQKTFSTDRFVVKFKQDGDHALLNSADTIINNKLKFRESLKDKSDDVDKLNSLFKVKRATKVFKKNAQNQHVYVFEVPAKSDIANIVKYYSELPNVEYAEPDYINKADFTPNDTFLSNMWGLNNTGQVYATSGPTSFSGTPDADIDAPEAWDINKGDGVIVAVIDTGIERNHPDLSANVWINPCEDLDHNGIINSLDANEMDDACPGQEPNGFADDFYGADFSTCAVSTENPPGSGTYVCTTPKSWDNNPQDGNGHGTHVAGTIAATGENSLGVVGVAYKAKVMAVKALDDTNGIGYSSDLAAAIVYAADNGAKVINNSWGGGGLPNVLSDAIKYAHYEKGAVLVFSAGNDNAQVSASSPAGMPETIAVAATTDDDTKASFSNYGNLISVAAPGELVLSTYRDDNLNGFSDDYVYMSGTSMAAPHVSGLAALLLSQNPNLHPDQVKQIIRNSADDVETAYPDTSTGYGRINARTALNNSWTGHAKINAPLNGATINTTAGMATITGRADSHGATFVNYQLYYRRINSDPYSAWVPMKDDLGNSVPVTSPVSIPDGVLRVWNMTDAAGPLPIGDYLVRLVVTASDGWNWEDIIKVRLDDMDYLRGCFEAARKIVAPNPVTSSQFGRDTLISGNTLFVGDIGYDGTQQDQGAVHVFQRQPDGTWGSPTQILAPDPVAGNFFGQKLAISNNILAIGNFAGAVYIYEKVGGNWTFTNKITAPAGSSGFATDVDVSNNLLAVGATQAVYMYTRQSLGNWTLTKTFTNPSTAVTYTNQYGQTVPGAAYDQFGRVVDVEGNYLAISARERSETNALYTGAVYMYEYNPGNSTWSTPTTLLRYPSPTQWSYFGNSLAMEGDTLVAGAFYDGFIGAVYVYKRVGPGNWGTPQKLQPSDFSGGMFGEQVDIENNVIVVGDQRNTVNGLTNAGAAYVFRKDAITGNWVQKKKLIASDPETSALFGTHLSLSGNTVAIGAYLKDESGNGGAGAVYTYQGCFGECLANSDCSDGQFCNGAETCLSSFCKAGKPPQIDDGVVCTSDWCNETTDTIQHFANNGMCDDGMFCNGVETCSPTLGCVQGPLPCNPVTQTCIESSDQCFEYNAGQAVVWTELVGVSANGNTLTKTAPTAWGNAGAASAQIVSGDGKVKFTAAETNTYRMAGFSSINTDANYTSINYALYLRADGRVYIYELGTLKANATSYVSGDIFTVERTGTTIRYMKNNSVIYTSAVASSGDLVVDSALYETNSKITNAVVFGGVIPPTPVYVPVSWTNLVGVSLSSNTITKTAAAGWGNAGAASVQTIPANGGVRFTVQETSTYRMAGLATSDVNANFTSINYALYFRVDGIVQIYESGTFKADGVDYLPGDVFTVERVGTSIRYRKNGFVFYASTVPSSGSLLVDSSLYTTGCSLSAEITGNGS